MVCSQLLLRPQAKQKLVSGMGVEFLWWWRQRRMQDVERPTMYYRNGGRWGPGGYLGFNLEMKSHFSVGVFRYIDQFVQMILTDPLMNDWASLSACKQTLQGGIYAA